MNTKKIRKEGKPHGNEERRKERQLLRNFFLHLYNHAKCGTSAQ
jgi:hypothetical protein